MKKFRFNLQALLTHRQRIQEHHQKIVASRLRELTREEALLQQLDSELLGSNDDMRDNRLRGRLNMTFVAAHRRYVSAIQQRITGQMGRISEIRQRLEMERMALMKASQQTRVLERLRERTHEEYAKRLRRVEETEANEIGLNSFRRGRQREVAQC